LGPILLSIIAFIFVPILFIGALGLARLLGSGGFWTLALGTAAKPKSVRADSFKLPSRKFDRLPIASSGSDALEQKLPRKAQRDTKPTGTK
jgi:hypothetical protein